MTTLKDNSRNTWKGQGSIEHINAGSLQRIADAVEKMALRHTDLIDEAARYKRWYYEERGWREKAERRITALKGVITKLRRKS